MKKILILLLPFVILIGCNKLSQDKESSKNSSETRTENSNIDSRTFSSEKLTENRKYRRAVEAGIWGMPIVATYTIRKGYLDLGAKYNDIIYISKVADWQFQTTTPNASTHYIYSAYTTKKDGPIVVEVPASIGAGIYGQLCDMWDVPLAIVGSGGNDKGNGGKYLILPPNYTEKIPNGYFPVKSETFGGFWLMRTIPKSNSFSDQQIAIDLIKKIRVYPLLSKKNKEQRYIDISGKLWNGIPEMDESFYKILAEMVNEEPVLSRDLAMMNMLKTLGIEKDKTYRADLISNDVLNSAILEAKAYFQDQVDQQLIPFWREKKWALPDATGMKTEFSYVTPGVLLDYDNRGMLGFYGWAPPMKADKNAPTIYLQTLRDKDGNFLSGDKVYKLNVPPNVPAKQYWSVTVYDLETAGFILNAKVISLDSFNPKTKKNSDGSIDIYFSGEPPKNMENNWVSTSKGGLWFPMFRLYGPEQAFFEKKWEMSDIEKVN